MFFPVPPKRDEPAAEAAPAVPAPTGPLVPEDRGAMFYSFAAQQLVAGTPHEEIEAHLVRMGLTHAEAIDTVGRMGRVRADALAEAGGQKMLFGGVLFGVGLLATIMVPPATARGSISIMALLAIVLGAVLFYRGLRQKADV